MDSLLCLDCWLCGVHGMDALLDSIVPDAEGREVVLALIAEKLDARFPGLSKGDA